MSSALFSSLSLAGLELANRIVVSPMCQYSADDGCANDWHLMHLGMLANSGAGLVVVEASHVERLGQRPALRDPMTSVEPRPAAPSDQPRGESSDGTS